MNRDVRPIRKRETHEWVLKKHYAKRKPQISFAYGLFIDEKMMGVCTFGIPASLQLCKGICGDDYRDIVLELNRLVIDDNASKNSASFFIGKCLKLLPKPRIIVSYADTKMGHIGKVYQSTNFIYTGKTKERTDIGLEDGSHSRHYDKNLDYKSNRKFRSSKHRYVIFIGNKGWKRNMIKRLKYPIHPYPKGETSRYDASYKPKIQTTLNISLNL